MEEMHGKVGKKGTNDMSQNSVETYQKNMKRGVVNVRSQNTVLHMSMYEYMFKYLS